MDDAERSYLKKELGRLEEMICEEERERRTAVLNSRKELVDDINKRIDRLVKDKQDIWQELTSTGRSAGLSRRSRTPSKS